jgi:hypothetical protein
MSKRCVSESENSAFRDDGAQSRHRDIPGFESTLRAPGSELKAQLRGGLLRFNIGELVRTRSMMPDPPP